MKNTNTHIIPNSGPTSNILPWAAEEETSPPGLTCRYCDAPAADNVTPPLCEKHLDVVVLICTLQERDLPVNAEYARHLLETALTNGGSWTITPAELEDMFVSTLRQVRATQRENANPPSPESGEGPGVRANQEIEAARLQGWPDEIPPSPLWGVGGDEEAQ